MSRNVVCAATKFQSDHKNIKIDPKTSTSTDSTVAARKQTNKNTKSDPLTHFQRKGKETKQKFQKNA